MARLFRLLIALLGAIAFLFLATQTEIAFTRDFAGLVLVLLAAELLLMISISRQRALSLGATFVFIAFLAFGAATASVIQLITWIISWLVQHARPDHQRPSWLFLVFNAGQLALCGLFAGGAVWLFFGTPLGAPPTDLTWSLAVYATSYLALNVLLTTAATWLRYGSREVTGALWPNVSLLTALSFVISMPLALLVFALRSQSGFLFDVVLAFSFLAALSYVVRINVRLNEANRELHALNAIGENLASSLRLDDLYPSIYESVRLVIPLDTFLIGFVNDEHTEIDYPFLVESGERLAPRSFALETSLADGVLRHGQPLLLADHKVEQGQNRFGRPDRHSASILMVPLCVGEEAFGVLSAQSYTPNLYTAHELSLLQGIGRIAAVAINNARLFAREKEVLRSREEFVSLVAHELKNPLAALLGHSQMLERRVRLADDKLRRPVSIIQEQGERMNQLVEDLLDLSRAETGRLALHLQHVDLTTLAKHVVEQQRVLTTRHELSVQSDGEMPLVEGDVLRLTQVLQNLLSNAIKYSPDGGTVHVSISTRQSDDARWPRSVRKSIDTAEQWVVVAVRDYGIGVPPDQIGRVFERFFRAKNTAQLDVAGTGLGLSVCEGLIRTQGGVMGAESEWGVGSTFWFALPVPPAHAR